jgi:hypothetical protein
MELKPEILTSRIHRRIDMATMIGRNLAYVFFFWRAGKDELFSWLLLGYVFGDLFAEGLHILSKVEKEGVDSLKHVLGYGAFIAFVAWWNGGLALPLDPVGRGVTFLTFMSVFVAKASIRRISS